MKARIAVALIAVFGGAGCGGPPTADTTPNVDEKVRIIAKALNAITPKSLGENLVMESARAEGGTLVMALRGLPQWEPTYTTADMAKIIGVGVCEQESVRRLFKEGGALRIDGTTPGGAALPTVRIDNCV